MNKKRITSFLCLLLAMLMLLSACGNEKQILVSEKETNSEIEVNKEDISNPTDLKGEKESEEEKGETKEDESKGEWMFEYDDSIIITEDSEAEDGVYDGRLTAEQLKKIEDTIKRAKEKYANSSNPKVLLYSDIHPINGKYSYDDLLNEYAYALGALGESGYSEPFGTFGINEFVNEFHNDVNEFKEFFDYNRNSENYPDDSLSHMTSLPTYINTYRYSTFADPEEKFMFRTNDSVTYPQMIAIDHGNKDLEYYEFFRDEIKSEYPEFYQSIINTWFSATSFRNYVRNFGNAFYDYKCAILIGEGFIDSISENRRPAFNSNRLLYYTYPKVEDEDIMQGFLPYMCFSDLNEHVAEIKEISMYVPRYMTVLNGNEIHYIATIKYFNHSLQKDEEITLAVSNYDPLGWFIVDEAVPERMESYDSIGRLYL